MLKFAVLASVAFALGAVPANATVPVIKGKYAVTGNEVCQAVEGSSTPGLIASFVETANFDPTTGMVAVTGAGSGGYLVVWPGDQAGYQHKTFSKMYSYSNTATTVTIGGITFDIVYGHLKKGVAQSAAVSGIDGSGCVEADTAIHQ